MGSMRGLGGLRRLGREWGEWGELVVRGEEGGREVQIRWDEMR
jgi:hypothetical protein